MAKQTTPTQDAPAAPDLSALRKELSASIGRIRSSENSGKDALRDSIVAIMEQREKTPDLERESVKALVQELVADAYGVKVEYVQSSPDKKLKDRNFNDWSLRNGAYTLVSQMLSVAWNKDETVQKKVAKLIKEEGDKISFTALLKAGRKPQTNPKGGRDNTITKKNLAEKLKAFIVKAATDMNESTDEVLDMIDGGNVDRDGILAAITTELESEQKSKEETEGK